MKDETLRNRDLVGEAVVVVHRRRVYHDFHAAVGWRLGMICRVTARADEREHDDADGDPTRREIAPPNASTRLHDAART